jgi:hypothetical protein
MRKTWRGVTMLISLLLQRTLRSDSTGTVFSHLRVGPRKAAAMLAAVGFVVYSAYYIKTHSRSQVVLAWVIVTVLMVTFLVVLKLLE